MDNFECKKCHKPLAHGNKCEACKQRDIDKKKSYVPKALAGAAAIAAIVIPAVIDKKDED